MKPAVSLFIIFVLASGLSAYIGNEWGRKLGKRKLSVFKLRPRHTSMILTVLISMSLSLGLLGTFLVAFPGLQESLLMPENQQIAESERYQQQSAEVSARLAQLNKQTQEARQNTFEQAPVLAQMLAQDQAIEPDLPLAQTDTGVQKPVSTPAWLPKISRPTIGKPAIQKQSPATSQLAKKPAVRQEQIASRDLPAKADLSSASPSTAAAQKLDSGTRPDRMARAQSSQSAQPDQASTQYASAPIFKLSVYGDLSPEESSQVLEGTLEMTRKYAALAGLQSGTARLAIPAIQMRQAQQRLQEPGAYAIEIRLAEVEGSLLPVNLQIKSEQALADFDPNSLMESARLNSAQTGDQLRQDLRLALKNLAKDHQLAPRLQASPSAPDAGSDIQTAQLPFDLLNLRQEQGTLLGTVIFSRNVKSLTQN